MLEDNLSAGTKVRLKSDPGRLGILTGQFRQQGQTKKYQINFKSMDQVMKFLLVFLIFLVVSSCATKHEHKKGSHYDHLSHNHLKIGFHSLKCY